MNRGLTFGALLEGAMELLEAELGGEKISPSPEIAEIQNLLVTIAPIEREEAAL